MARMRVGVVGAGILGLATARRLAELRPDAEIVVFDKEDRVAAHQTGHNSGVVHAGLYYEPGSLKATLCRRGVELLHEFCDRHLLSYREVGKLVVARDESELPRLLALQERAWANNVPGLRQLSGSRLQEVEPNVAGVAALHSPHTAIVDFSEVARALADEVTQSGGAIRLRSEVTKLRRSGREVRLVAAGDAHAFDRVVLCAGLQADRVARMAGDGRRPALVPFRGEYLRLAPERSDLVQGLIYPVPDPRMPFLGVHFTRRIDGAVDIGPNAVLAFAREGYQRRDVEARDVLDALRRPEFWRMARRHWRSGLTEARGSLSRRAYLRAARAYVPALRDEDVAPAPSGVRAQAIDADGSFVDDFRVSRLDRVVALRNAPSPAATSSLAIAEHVAEQVLDGG